MKPSPETRHWEAQHFTKRMASKGYSYDDQALIVAEVVEMLPGPNDPKLVLEVKKRGRCCQLPGCTNLLKGRVDKKFCSDAHRQRNSRASRLVTVTKEKA